MSYVEFIVFRAYCHSPTHHCITSNWDFENIPQPMSPLQIKFYLRWPTSIMPYHILCTVKKQQGSAKGNKKKGVELCRDRPGRTF